MKTDRINKMARISGMIVVLVLFSGLTSEVRAQNGAKGGASKLLQLSAGPAVPAVSAVTETKPMACSKCKDEFSTRVDLTARGANKPTILVAKHLCEGCGTDWSVVGHGKAKVSVATHKCTSCGAESLACCNTKKTSDMATKGMEKKIEVAPLK